MTLFTRQIFQILIAVGLLGISQIDSKYDKVGISRITDRVNADSQFYLEYVYTLRPSSETLRKQWAVV